MKGFVFSGGEPFYPEFVDVLPKDEDLTVAADAGVKKLESLGVIPDVIVGDMDSFDEKTARDRYPDAEYIGARRDKDCTDTKLAVDICIDRGCKEIYIIGGLGGRLDHTLSNIFLLTYIRDMGAAGYITDGKNFAHLIYENERSDFRKDPLRKYLSLIPISEELSGVTMRGFAYPLENANASRRDAITVSNEIVDDSAEIFIGRGCALVIRCCD